MPRTRAARDLAGFALSVWAGRVIQAASETSDYLLIGRILGGAPLGLYGMARDLLRFVPDRLHRVAGRVTYAAFCQLQDDDRELARTYTNFFGSIARIVWPIMVCMAVTAPDLVSTAYGPQWIAAALPLRLLTAGMIAAGLNVAISSIYFAKGYPSLDIHLNGLRLILMVAAVVALRHTGLLGVVAVVSGVELASALVAQYVCCRFTGLGARELIAETMPGVRLAIACGLVAAVGEVTTHAWGGAGPQALLVAGIPAAIVYLHYEASNLITMATRAFGGQANSEPIQRLSDREGAGLS
jgi:O-antigen/teichoic acid export membrane protein